MIDVLHAPAGSIFTGKMIKDWIRANLGKDGPEGEAAGRVELYLRLCNDDQEYAVYPEKKGYPERFYAMEPISQIRMARVNRF